MFGYILEKLAYGSSASELSKEVEELRRSLSVANQQVTDERQRAATANGKLAVMSSEVTEMTRELRIFTEVATRLYILTESRSHAHFLRAELDQAYGPLERVRKCARTRVVPG